MRLKQIILIGFKSFAKRSVINVGDGLLGLVGPNGCGKSNIVDALRWVMGESRATQLRQELNTDIIFNGAAGQRAADWCSVELLVANDGSRDLGMWGEYAELSVRRQIEREGDSSYFINGQRVRRRDVVDLFAGTGSGARSYGIVEQERITTIVKAEPKRIRAHLEEAAGVAIYKERRRETESKIRSAQASLERLDDSTAELRRQRDALARQAQVTAKMREARARLEVARQLELLLRFEAVEAGAREAEETAAAAAKEAGALRTRHSGLEKDMEGLNKRRHARAAEASKLQADYYKAVAAKEKRQQALRDYESQTKQEREQMEAATAEAKETAGRVADLEAELAAGRERHKELAAAAEAAGRRISGAEKEEQEAARRRDEAAERLVQAEEEAAAARQRRSESEAAAQVVEHRRADQARQLVEAEHELEHLAPVEEPDAKALARVRDGAERARRDALDNEKRRQEQSVELAEAKEEILRLQGEQGGLQAERELLREIAGKLKDRYADWLAARGLDAAATLAEASGIKAPGCEKAVDAVLGHLLEGFETRDLPALLAAGEMPEGLVLLDPALAPQEVRPAPPPPGLRPLIDAVEAKPQWRPLLGCWLAQAFLAPDRAAALAALPQLAPGQLAVTADGTCFAPGAASGRRSRRAGVEWNSRLKEVEARLAELAGLAEAAGRRRDAVAKRLAELEAKAAGLVERREREDAVLARAEQEALRRKHAAEYHAEQSRRLRAAIERGRKEVAAQEKELAAAAKRQAADAEGAEKAAAAAAARRAEARTAEEALEASRAASGELKGALHEARMEAGLNEQRNGALEERLVEAKLALAKARTAIVSHQSSFRQRDSSKLEGDIAKAGEAVAAAQEAVATLERGIKELDAEQAEQEAARQSLRTELEQAEQRLRDGELAAAAKRAEGEAFKAQLAERSVDAAELAKLRERHAGLEEAGALVARLESRIERAGPVNYAAEDEHRACEERLAETEGQRADVSEALAALQEAIKRIDAEMLGRIKDVHGRLNLKFSEMFHKLFSGGSAAVELDSEDFLAADMQLKVSLPGKRVANIHALSGGEKTLTALAFIFALNDLNPPPFCVLDEVDAALDDANTMRFCSLLEAMKGRSQFLLVTHNKQVIERADHLVGVTQEEKGVTKLVAVRLDEAVEQARAAGG
ncbi:MAG: chromosome segregation protein SMC [Betaproteobacteria bacterium AqS2]|uniref:Chromosome partition protein Smc n=1 Tax=Candidatus Amphirhobacter heronislandensis TaxID=1732024 RepID=A0A930UCA6_9GAMM|nr:chromosome segregation protein SMC [Betaproteobacteria bacterium AqS2]